MLQTLTVLRAIPRIRRTVRSLSGQHKLEKVPPGCCGPHHFDQTVKPIDTTL